MKKLWGNYQQSVINKKKRKAIVIVGLIILEKQLVIGLKKANIWIKETFLSSSDCTKNISKRDATSSWRERCRIYNLHFQSLNQKSEDPMIENFKSEAKKKN